jgi:DNA-binding protein HU-beta
MTKTELIAQVAEKCEISQKEAAMAVNVTVAEITRALVHGESVRITGFGTFLVRQHAARQGRNPRTGAALRIAAHKSPGFRAGEELKKSVSKKK